MKKLLFLLLLPSLSWGQFNGNFTNIGDSVATGYIRGFGDTGDLILDAGGGATSGVRVVSYGDNPKILLQAADTLVLTTTGVGSYITAGSSYGDPGHYLYIDGTQIILNDKINFRGGLPISGGSYRFWQTYANGTEIINTSSQTIFSDSIAVDSGAIQTGGTLKFRTYLTAGHTNATPSVTIRLRWNAEVLADAVVSLGAASGTSSPIAIDWYVTVISATTTRTTWSINYYPGTGSFVAQSGLDDCTLSATDFDDAGHLKFSAQWTAASASNKITMKQIIGEYSETDTP